MSAGLPITILCIAGAAGCIIVIHRIAAAPGC
jgi:hypothetical protein